MDGWKEAKAGLRIAYSNQKSIDVKFIKYGIQNTAGGYTVCIV